MEKIPKTVQIFDFFIIQGVSGGPVSYQFNFLQFHMHWGDQLDKGSEHLLDGKPFSAEVGKN